MCRHRIRLNAPTVAVVVQYGKSVAVQIPAGAEIVIVDDLPNFSPNPLRQVKAEWDGKCITMFAFDILERGVRLAKTQG